MKPRPLTPPPSRAGLWSTIAEAVRGGWGSTLRVLAVLGLLGAILITLAILGDHATSAPLIRAIVGAAA